MLQAVDVGTQHVEHYARSAGHEAIAELRRLAAPLQGVRILHVNSTPYGGGVAELLRSEVPLLRDLGLHADWSLISGDNTFFGVTKLIHNGLQGATQDLSATERETYLTHAVRNAQLLEGEYDIVVIHDPQPLPILHYHGRDNAKWIWRCHIDTSSPNPHTWEFLRPFLDGYDAAGFTMQEFVPPGFPDIRVSVVPPAIDPQSPKNMELPLDTAQEILQWIGIHPEQPLVTQVSRFDPWKDPLGVIVAFQLAKRSIPRLQLALVGSMALDDPEGWHMYEQIQAAAKDDPAIHIFTNLTGVGNVEVNAFQRLSTVVIQKSLREGFGLVVSETLWKSTPVVAGRAGGIPLQLQDGVSGFLIDSSEQCAEKIVWLVNHPDEAHAIGKRGRQAVHKHFLLPRLIADHLRLYAKVLGLS